MPDQVPVVAYAVSGPEPIDGPSGGPVGWSGDDPHPTTLILTCRVGAGADSVEVHTIREQDQTALPDDLRARMPQIHERQAVTMLLSGATGERELRFPLVIERDEVPIDMDGRGQMFTVYAYEDHAHAVARIDGLQLIVRCSRSLLQDGLELRRLQTKELVEMAPQGFLENNPIRRLKRRWRR